MVEWEMYHKHAKYLMCKSFYIFHNKAIQKRLSEKIHQMLITLDNIDLLIYSRRYNNSFY